MQNKHGHLPVLDRLLADTSVSPFSPFSEQGEGLRAGQSPLQPLGSQWPHVDLSLLLMRAPVSGGCCWELQAGRGSQTAIKNRFYVMFPINCIRNLRRKKKSRNLQ